MSYYKVAKESMMKLMLEKAFMMENEAVFKLASGKMSKYYMNCKLITMKGEGLLLTGSLFLKHIRAVQNEIVAVGGLEFGACPIACALALYAYSETINLNAFMIRKVKKEHGTMQWIEGDVKANDKVVILEDVVTTGGSTIRAVERARECGLDVNRIIVLFNREEDNDSGIKNIREQTGIANVTSIITLSELIEFYETRKVIENV